jgi:hypothetical protein
MSTKTFFDDQKEQSAVKSTIVSKYFWAWTKVCSDPKKVDTKEALCFQV